MPHPLVSSRRIKRWLMRGVLALVLLTTFVHCASRTEAPPLPTGVKKEHTRLDLAGRSVSLTLYRPAKDENAPLVVVAHGFTRSKRYMAGWGGHLAGQGFFVVVPTQPAFADHELNGRVLAALVEKYRQKRRVALMGFSMGGLTTLLAATHTSVDAWVGLDPVDMNGKGKVAAAKLKIPIAFLLAEPEAWNMQGNANSIAEAVPGKKLVFRVQEGTHLDAEWPTDFLGQLACGFVDEKRQQQFRNQATQFLKAKLLK
jgi:dienelactone hydrolase